MSIDRLSRVTLCLLVLGLAVGGPVRHGYAARDAIGTRAIALGGALRAAPSSVAAPILNPASLSLRPEYAAGATYAHRTADAGHLFNAAVIDSKTAAVAAGILYTFRHQSPEVFWASDAQTDETPEKVRQSITSHEVAVAASYPLGTVAILGMTTKYINASSSITTEAAADLRGPNLSKMTIDVGGIIRAFGPINLAVVGYNLIHVEDYHYPRSMGVGVSWAIGQRLLLVYDTVLDFTSDPDRLTLAYHGGLEVMLSQFTALRAGGMYDGLFDQTSVSAGLALISPRAGMEFSFRQTVDGGSSTLFAGSLQFFF